MSAKPDPAARSPDGEPAQQQPLRRPRPVPAAGEAKPPVEIGGPPGPEPTRYGDWQFNGRCTDF